MNKYLDICLEKEEEVISSIYFRCENSETNSDPLKQIASKVHANIISSLIFQYVQNSLPEFDSIQYSHFFEGELDSHFSIDSISDIDILPTICELLHIEYLNSQFLVCGCRLVRKKSKDNLIEKGAVYTQERIVKEIVGRTLNNIHCDSLGKSKILDFATGTGRFYREIVKIMQSKYGIDYDYSILNNVYGVDLDPVAINICRLLAFSMLSNKDIVALGTISNHIICRNALTREICFDDSAIKYEDCDGLFYSGFDAIVSNPPYLVLKPNRRKMDEATVNKINNLAKHFRKSPFYVYSIEGMLNLYQLSLEAMLSMLKENGEMGIICPSTLFADVSSSKLRKHLLKKHNVYYIKFFSENDSLFENVTQATCIFHLTKDIPTSDICINNGDKEYKISIDDVKTVFDSNWEIPSIERIEWDILKKLLVVPMMKNWNFIRNKRGELDLTLCKDYITMDPTDYRLVRGNMVLNDTICDINHEYVKAEFLKKKSNDYLTNDQGRRRLVCQQISNQAQSVRLKFVECQKNDILGNSCNYITVQEKFIPQMKVLLNSALLNWRFKVTSSNNHINNYELDELPIIDLNMITSDIVELEEVKRNIRICALYGLEDKEIKYIIRQHYDAL